MMMAEVTYLLTFTCYGSHLRGDARGSFRRRPHEMESPIHPPNARLEAADRARQTSPAYSMKPAVRHHVLAAIRETCAFRGWGLHAVHVREEHVHVVVDAEVEPERVMTDLKAWATRRLQGVEPEVDRRWTRHGSTNWLRRPESIRAAVRYVADGQGEPMAVYVAPEYGGGDAAE
jgi:REP element-mobilizing transposase RayT